MSEFQIYLLIGAAFVASISWRLPRAALWIAIGMASFFVSTWYSRQDAEYGPAVTALCDAAVCFLIYGLMKERWEKLLFLLFQGSVLTSILYFAGVIGPHWAYVVFLETINWAALGVIGGTSLIGWVHRARRDHSGAVDHIRRAHRSLHQEVHTPFKVR